MHNLVDFLEITILIPCYNAQRTLDRLFNSIARQKYPRKYLTIICTNDGSTDNTLQVLQSWQTKFGKESFIIIDQENQGLAESRNILVSHVKTPFLTFIDSDDFYEKNALINLSKSSDDGTADITTGKIYRRNKNKKISFWLSNFKTSNIDQYIGNNLFFVWNKLYKTSLINSANFHWVKGADMLEDQLFFTSIMPHVKKIRFCKHHTYNFVYSKNSMSSVSGMNQEAKFAQTMNNLDAAIRNVLQERIYAQLTPREKKVLTGGIYNFLMQIFMLFVLWPAYYGFNKSVQNQLRDSFYSEKRYAVNEVLDKYGVKFYAPFGWWRKLSFVFLRLKDRYNVNKYKMYDKNKKAKTLKPV